MATGRAQKKLPDGVTIALGAHVWPHELVTAQALARAGYDVLFDAASAVAGVKSADIKIDNEEWEIKSPISNKLSSVERNLKRASRQAPRVIFDSIRMGKLPDTSIHRELVKQLRATRAVKRILFVNRQRGVIDLRRDC